MNRKIRYKALQNYDKYKMRKAFILTSFYSIFALYYVYTFVLFQVHNLRTRKMTLESYRICYNIENITLLM